MFCCLVIALLNSYFEDFGDISEAVSKWNFSVSEAFVCMRIETKFKPPGNHFKTEGSSNTWLFDAKV